MKPSELITLILVAGLIFVIYLVWESLQNVSSEVGNFVGGLEAAPGAAINGISSEIGALWNFITGQTSNTNSNFDPGTGGTWEDSN